MNPKFYNIYSFDTVENIDFGENHVFIKNIPLTEKYVFD